MICMSRKEERIQQNSLQELRTYLQTIPVKMSKRDMFWIKSWEIYDLKSLKKIRFSITPFVADEMRLIEDKDIPRYLFHRYRYEIYPQLHKLDDYPPYLQIEPSSICNYRCVFCYQTDEGFSEKKSDHMGTMRL